MLASTIEFPWPRPPAAESAPVWQNGQFIVDGRPMRLLSYAPGASNWTDDLTSLHEAAAGSGDHPIDRASRAYAIRQVRKNLPSPKARILEVGSSSGFFLRDMVRAFPEATIIGSDIVTGPLAALSQRCNVPLLHFDLVQCPLPDNCIDVGVLLNVLEHIEDDVGAVRQLFRILKPGGVAVIEVPAGPQLYNAYDRVLMHWRRYRLKELCGLFTDAGFEIQHRSHMGFFLYPAFRHSKLRDVQGDVEAERRRVEREIRSTRRNHLVSVSLRLEQVLGRVLTYPIGIRCQLTARKPLDATGC